MLKILLTIILLSTSFILMGSHPLSPLPENPNSPFDQEEEADLSDHSFETMQHIRVKKQGHTQSIQRYSFVSYDPDSLGQDRSARSSMKSNVIDYQSDTSESSTAEEDDPIGPTNNSRNSIGGKELGTLGAVGGTALAAYFFKGNPQQETPAQKKKKKKTTSKS